MLDPILAEFNESLLTGCWFVSAVATADAIISVSCASVVGMFRVGSVTVLATTLNVVGAVEEEKGYGSSIVSAASSSHSARFFVGVRNVACTTLNSKFDDVRF